MILAPAAAAAAAARSPSHMPQVATDAVMDCGLDYPRSPECA